MIMLAFHNTSQVGRDADEPVIDEALPNKAGGIGELGQTAIFFRTSSSCGVRDFTALSDVLGSIRCQKFSRYSTESARVLRKQKVEDESRLMKSCLDPSEKYRNGADSSALIRCHDGKQYT